MKKNSSWLFFVAGRFGSVDSRGRSALASLLSSLGIAFGVMALIVILSVMNGFQMGYIESILEVSSAHVRLSIPREEIAKVASRPEVRAAYEFGESQTLMLGRYDRQQGVLLRSLPADIMKRDGGFASSVKMESGSFSVGSPRSVVLGYELARLLSVSTGDTVSLVAVSGDSSTDLFPENATLTVTGLFKTGYYEIDSTFAFVSLDTGYALTGKNDSVSAAVKLADSGKDAPFIAALAATFRPRRPNPGVPTIVLFSERSASRRTCFSFSSCSSLSL